MLPFTTASIRIKYSWNKFNQGGERPIHSKLLDIGEKKLKTRINKRIFCAHKLEELILLKCPKQIQIQ